MAKSWQEIAKISSSNLEGHKYLYNHGFYIITSTKESLEYFKRNSIKTSAMVWQEFLESAGDNYLEAKSNLSENPKLAKEFYNKIKEAQKFTSDKLNYAKDSVVEAELKIAKDTGKKALSGFLNGFITIRKRTQNDFEEIKNTPNKYLEDLKNDFSNLEELIGKFKNKKQKAIEESNESISWSESFSRAQLEFNNEYEKTKSDNNTLIAMPKILWGHLKAIYWAVVKPLGVSTYKGVSESGHLITKGIEKFILLPVASSVIIGGRTLYSIGGVVYHVGSAGVNILSPVTETTLHAATSLIALASTVPSFTLIQGANIFSQVTLEGSSIVLPATGYVAKSVEDISVSTGKIIYETAKAAGKIIYSNTTSAVVLGYNAISALPSHAVMGAVNSTVFLVYDGPRLFIAWSRGELGPDQIPVGSVIDYQKLKESNIEVNKIELDEDQMEKVINGLEVDLGQK